MKQTFHNLPRIIGLLAATVAAAAAPPTVQLRGIVLDENGLPVAGAEVVVQSPDGKAQTAHTDEAGRFELAFPSAGEYRASLNKLGYFRLADRPVLLNEGLNEASFTLSHESEIQEKIEVRSSVSGIEPEETTHQAVLVAREIRDIPVPSTHDLNNSLPALAGVLRDNAGRLHVAGARAGEAEVVLDGFEIGDAATGEFTARVNVDAVRTVEVETGRYAASYAHAGAGVLVLDTVVGDDRWRFGTTNFIPGVSLQQGTHLGNWFPRFTLSGPVHKGRAWFSDAMSVQHSFQLIPEQPRGQNTVTQWAGDNLLRAQINLTRRQVLQGSFLYNQANDSHLGLTAFSPLSTTTDFASRRYFVSAKDQIWVRNTLVEFGAAVDSGRSQSLPQGSADYVLTPSGTSGNYFEAARQRARRWQLVGGVSAPSRRWHGSHDLAAGLNVDGTAFTHNAMRGRIEVRDNNNNLLQSTTFSGSSGFNLSNTRVGAYVQDSWQLARALEVRAGLRADHDGIIEQTVVAPRLSANVLPFRDDRAKLALGWGVYYQPIDLALVGQGLDQQRTDVFYDASGMQVGNPATTQFALPPSGLKQPRFYTTSVEWLQKLGSATLAGVHLVQRDERRGFAYENLLPGQPGASFLLQNNRRDRYRAVELSFRHSFGEKAEVFADYIRSRARSNEVLDNSLGSVLFAAQAPGPLAWDAPNRFIVWGWVPAPVWHLLVGYFLEYRTGFPFSVVNQGQQLVGAPNRLRFPDYFSLNLGVEKRFRFRGHEWAGRLAFVNLTGRNNPNVVNNNIDSTTKFMTFAGGQRRALSARLRLVGRK